MFIPPCSKSHPCGLRGNQLTRRDVLKLIGASAGGLLLSACGAEREASPVSATAIPTSTPPATAVPPGKTAVLPTPTTSVPPTPAAASVAIQRVASYEPRLVRQHLQSALEALGGIGDLIRPGARVAIKVNLTGGSLTPPMRGVARIESYFTHPAVVRALGELLRDGGASRLYIVEGIFTPDSSSESGYWEAAQALEAQLIDLNSAYPYRDFYQAAVGEGWFCYDSFVFNPILENIDVFISVAKMKCHWNTGVTLSMKNLIGLVPVRPYRNRRRDRERSAFHGQSVRESGTRLPRVILDLNRARPIDLAIIDGIKTVDGGEGPWRSLSLQEAHLLVAGKNPVATDAVATALMGFDPTAEYPSAPFLRGENHLNLARRVGLGTNRLEAIRVAGEAIEEARGNFRPSW